MIVPGLSEDKLLAELVADKECIARKVRKIAREKILRLQKSGRDGINEELGYTYEISNIVYNNTWRVALFINMAKNPKWYHLSVCCVESGQGTKDYYFVRGFSQKKPYYIKVSSHAMKRFIERAFTTVSKEKVAGIDLAPILIRKGEVITWMKVADPKLWKYTINNEEENELIKLFYTFYGCYLGCETENGNYVFKTYLNKNTNFKKWGEKESMLTCKYAHMVFNESFYDKKFIENIMDDEMKEMNVGIKQCFKFKLVP